MSSEGQDKLENEHIWLTATDIQEASQTLDPILRKNKKELLNLVKDAITLEVVITRKSRPHILAMLMPTYWKTFIRGIDITQA